MDGLFAEQERAQAATAAAEKRERWEAAHRQSWLTCWNWKGPTVGGLCEVYSLTAETSDGDCLYCYMEQVRLIEQQADGRWLAEIAMGEVWGKPWPKDGTRLLLADRDIWPPVRQLRAEREAREAA